MDNPDNYLPVLCGVNDNPRFDGKVWLEPLVDVVERNGEALSHPLPLSAFNEGDSVKVQRISKGNRTIWNGTVTYKSYSDLIKKLRSSKSKQPYERSVKRKKAKLTQSEVPKKKSKIGE